MDLTDRGMGVRCTRFALVVDDGTVSAVQVEDNPGAFFVYIFKCFLNLQGCLFLKPLESDVLDRRLAVAPQSFSPSTDR